MTTTTLRPKIVKIVIKEGREGLFFATSPDLHGLLVAEPTLQALDEAIPKAIADLYLAKGVRVVVSKADDDTEDQPWIAFPVELAQAAIEAERCY